MLKGVMELWGSNAGWGKPGGRAVQPHWTLPGERLIAIPSLDIDGGELAVGASVCGSFGGAGAFALRSG
jgi:hypothetical protein